MRLIVVRHALLVCVAAIAGCRGVSSPTVTAPDQDGPAFDRACLDRARAGTLVETMPLDVSGFDVVRTEVGARVSRPGRALSEAEGRALWQAFQHAHFGGGMLAGHHASTSIYKCDGVADASCITLSVRICQLGLRGVAAAVASAAHDIGADDAELAAEIDYAERGGPPCKNGGACPPIPHYSTPSARFEPDEPARRVTPGYGRCKNHGDCAVGVQTCSGWWLAAGAGTTEYRQYAAPTLCGCLDSFCSWFTHD